MFGNNKQLKKLKKSSTPSRAFKSTLLTQLKSEMEQTTMPKASLIMRHATVGITSLVLVFGLGTGVYAYESPEVVEGHVLSGVKDTIEDAEGTIAAWRNRRAVHSAKMLERRLEEAGVHAEKPGKVKRLMAAAAGELGIALEDLREGLQDDASKDELLDRLALVNEKYSDMLERLTSQSEDQDDDEDFDEEEAWRNRRYKQMIGPEVAAIRMELKDEDLSPEERREEFRTRMDDLFEERRDEHQAVRDELEASGLTGEELEEAIRDRMHEIFKERKEEYKALKENIRDIKFEDGAALQKLYPRLFEEHREEYEAMKAEFEAQGMTDEEIREAFRRELEADLHEQQEETEAYRNDLLEQLQAEGFEGDELEEEMRARRYQMLLEQESLDRHEEKELRRLEHYFSDEDGDDDEYEGEEYEEDDEDDWDRRRRRGHRGGDGPFGDHVDMEMIDDLELIQDVL